MTDDETSRLIVAVVAGITASLVAFALATWRDAVKTKRETRARRKRALVGFVREMEANSQAAHNDLTLLASEQRDRDNGQIKAYVNSLSSFEAGAWALARQDLDPRLQADYDLVRRLQIIDRTTADLNSLIQSRENFRLQHLSNDVLLAEGLDGYANVLLVLMQDLRKRHREAIEHLVPYTRSRPWARDILVRDSSGIWLDQHGVVRGLDSNPIHERCYRWFGWILNR